MANHLDFNKNKKQYMTVTLPDENKTVIMIGTPRKGVLDELVAMKDSIGSDDIDADALDDLYGVCAKIMSNNKGGKVITSELLQDVLDYEDIIIFIKAYTAFIEEVANSKN